MAGNSSKFAASCQALSAKERIAELIVFGQPGVARWAFCGAVKKNEEIFISDLPFPR